MKKILLLGILAVIMRKRIYLLMIIFELFHEAGHIIAKKCTNEKQKIARASGGPVTNLILILAAGSFQLLTNNNNETFNLEIKEIIWANFIIFAFNIIPIYPLSGGKIINAILEKNYDCTTAYMVTNQISNITIIILTILSSLFILRYKNIVVIICLTYLWLIVLKENKKYIFIKCMIQKSKKLKLLN